MCAGAVIMHEQVRKKLFLLSSNHSLQNADQGSDRT